MNSELDGKVYLSVAPETRYGTVLQALEAAEKVILYIYQ